MFDSDAELIHSQKIFVIPRHILHHEVVVCVVRWHHTVDPFLLILDVNIALCTIIGYRWPAKASLAEYSKHGSLNHSNIVINDLKDAELYQKQNKEGPNSNADEVDDVS